MDFAVADMANAIARLGRSTPRPSAVKLRHAAPADVTALTEHYGVTPNFGTPLYELVYSAELTNMPIASFNSRLRDYFDEECKRLIGETASGPGLVDQLKKHLVRSMDGGDSSIEAVAKQLGISARSLQRRLAEEGTRYNDVLISVREEFAKRYLARGTVSASEVAYLVGFTEPPAFFKAFKRWTGMTPREFQVGTVSG
jgi:AraC-like DNA-binding protein